MRANVTVKKGKVVLGLMVLGLKRQVHMLFKVKGRSEGSSNTASTLLSFPVILEKVLKPWY